MAAILPIFTGQQMFLLSLSSTNRRGYKMAGFKQEFKE